MNNSYEKLGFNSLADYHKDLVKQAYHLNLNVGDHKHYSIINGKIIKNE